MTETPTMNSPVLHLRPHHLLCIQNYRGHGYSPGFHEKMTSVIALLQSPGGAAIELTEGADDLCAACPHCRGHACESDNPARFDKLVCEAAGAVPGLTFLWKLPCSDTGDSSFRLPEHAARQSGNLRRFRTGENGEGSKELGTPRGTSTGVKNNASALFFTLPAMSKKILKSCCAGCSWLELCLEIAAD